MSSKKIKMSKEDWENARKNSDFIIEKLGNLLVSINQEKEKELYEGQLANSFAKFLRKAFINFRDTIEKINDSTKKFDKEEILLSISDLTNLKMETNIARQTLKEDTTTVLEKLDFKVEDNFCQEFLNNISAIMALFEQFEQMIQEVIDKK